MKKIFLFLIGAICIINTQAQTNANDSLIHPYFAHATDDSPLLMLIVIIGIGALLVSLHYRLEKSITRVIVEKNEKIRLAAAHKTIAKPGDKTE